MIAYLSILAFLFFTITNGQATYWTGGGGGNNNTLSNPLNWSNGAPTATSIIYINETGCNNCQIVVDEAMTVAELHLQAITGTGPDFQITGVKLTVTTALTIGSPNPTTYWSTSITLNAGATLEIGPTCTATIYYTGGTPIGSSYQEQNWLINNGNVTVLGNGGITAGSYATLYIGSGSSYPLWVESSGSWSVPDGTIELRFYYVNVDIFGGSLWGSWLTTTGTSSPSIVFYGTNVVLQPNPVAGTAAPDFAGPISFYSVNTQYFTDYSTTPPNSLTFNATGLTVSNSVFSGTNIVFLFDGWIQDCNITSYSLVNSSSTVSGIHAYLTGSNILNDAVVAGVNTDFIVQVEDGSTTTMNSEFALTGTVTLINNGTWVYDSGDYLYFDVQAYWVNLGLMNVINHYNDYIYGTEFPGLSTYTDAGTMVNMGTIQFSNTGGLNFQQATGTFYQCNHGIMKFGYGSDFTTTPGTVTLPHVKLDGYIGIYNSDPTVPLDGTELFSWIFDASDSEGLFTGNVGLVVSPSLTQKICYEDTATSGPVSLYAYPLLTTTDILCPSGYSLYVSLDPTDVCSSLPASITALEGVASCPAGNNCGFDTGVPAGEPSPASASTLAIPFAFLVSLVCLLLKF
jgi:hypothetical protein